jgi:outer membrane protein assembly factor BamB
VWSTPLVTQNAVYVATMEGKLWKLSPSDLSTIWSAPFSVSAALLTPPTMLDANTVLVGGIGKTLYAVDANDGTQKWAVSGKNWFWGPPAIDGTTVYATDLGGEVKAIDGTTGTEIWTFKSNESIRSGVVVTDGMIVVVDNSGQVFRLSKDTGESQGQPNELKETVYATPLLLSATAAAAASPTPSAAASPTASAAASPTASAAPQSEGPTVLIVTQGGHLWTLDVTLGRTTEVVS